MKTVFLCHATEQRSEAARIHAALSADGLTVFFDEEGLRGGDGFHAKVPNAIDECDLFVFLVSPDSIRDDKYARSELRAVKKKWPNPVGRVLPVQVVPTDPTRMDPYLRDGVHILRPEGDLPAEVLMEVRALVTGERPARTPPIVLDALWEQRTGAYRALWSLTAALPKWPRATDATYDMLSGLSNRLQEDSERAAPVGPARRARMRLLRWIRSLRMHATSATFGFFPRATRLA